MKTDAKTMVEVLRKAADNIENGLDKNDGIQAMYGDDEWVDRLADDLCFVKDVLYRIKPKTIIVNGVEIPKPLELSDVISGIRYYKVSDSAFLYCRASADEITYGKFKFIYKTEEEAIEASKKLFGIE